MSTQPETIAEAKQRYIDDDSGDYWELTLEADIERLIDASGYPETPWDEAVTTDPDALEGDDDDDDPGPRVFDEDENPANDDTSDSRTSVSSGGSNPTDPIINIRQMALDSADVDIDHAPIAKTDVGRVSGLSYSGEFRIPATDPLVSTLEEGFSTGQTLTILAGDRKYEGAVITRLTDQHVDDDPDTLRVSFEATDMTITGGGQAPHAHDILNEEDIDQLVTETIEQWTKAQYGREVDDVTSAAARSELVDTVKSAMRPVDRSFDVRSIDDYDDSSLTIGVSVPSIDYHKRFVVPYMGTEPLLEGHATFQ